ncbi:hypothetical protein HRbin10_00669 [bacterium HR10]|nr:hypothetical protein HRbin10_00669 [bacterium HR10]
MALAQELLDLMKQRPTPVSGELRESDKRARSLRLSNMLTDGDDAILLNSHFHRLLQKLAVND